MRAYLSALKQRSEIRRARLDRRVSGSSSGSPVLVSSTRKDAPVEVDAFPT
jgi:hypothetical protein